MYPLIRKILFLLDAEKAHYVSMNALKAICSIPGMSSILRWIFQPQEKGLEKNVYGLHFKNPIGLGAGFDKNACYLKELDILGFGFVEIGTVTPLPQQGNNKPRLFRLPADQALINRMGFNNDGAKAIRERLEEWKGQGLPAGRKGTGNREKLIIGGNIGKNKNTPNEDAWKDYETCFNELFEVVDYFVVNVSSPNTPGLRELQDKDALTKILTTLQENNSKRINPKPILLKIAPDLTADQLKDIASMAKEIKLDGIVSSNTTISRELLSISSKNQAENIGAGGLSGKPLKAPSDSILKQIIELTENKIPVIASGGIFSPEDANDKFKLGASLIQVWTGFIYEGPFIVKKISKDLIR